MCCGSIFGKQYHTPLGVISGPKIKNFLRTFGKIIKAIVARSLYALYTILIVWRVTVALNDDSYWSLLFPISLIAMEALHTIVWRKGGEMKWVTPSVFFYLVCAVPSIWLLELKLLSDRQSNNGTSCTTESSSTSSVADLTLSDDDWTLAMEQILIFVLVFGKWIAPKGELTRDQLSQLLLVQLGTGADIMELLESFNENEVSNNSDIVYLVMSIWSWSLLQFCIVPTAYKEEPKVEDPINPDDFDSIGQPSFSSDQNIRKVEKSGTSNSEHQNTTEKVKEPSNQQNRTNNGRPTNSRNLTGKQKGVQPQGAKYHSASRSGSRNKVGVMEEGQITATPKHKVEINDIGNKVTAESSNPKGKVKNIPTSNGNISKPQTRQQHDQGRNIQASNTIHENSHQNQDPAQWDHAIIVIHDMQDDLKIKDTANEWISGKRCCTSFCFYNEIWGMVLTLAFQDFPFLITRLIIMFHYKVVSHMTVFFTFKNIVTITLVLNRIRVVVLEEREPWKERMGEVLKVRKRNAELLREKKRRELTDGVEREPRNPNHEDTANADEIPIVDNGKAKKSSFKKPKWLFWKK